MSIDDALRDAVEAGAAPFVVAMVGDSERVRYSGAYGDAAPGRPAAENDVFRVFSMTKAIGAFAAMQLIDRGRLGVDTPVADILPEWNEVSVLEGFDGDSPVLRAPSVAATVRHLATHTSGMEYEFWNADVARYFETTGHPSVISGLKASLNYPLTAEPGTKWGYGPSIDWLGRMVETVDGRRVDRYCREEIFEPLGMYDTAFEPGGLEDRLVAASVRGEDGAFAPLNMAPPPNPEFYGMGHALYSTAPDYMRFLRMMLNGGELDGNRILSEQGIAAMLSDQMNGLRFEKMTSVSPVTADVVLPAGTTHSFIATLSANDVPGGRAAGSQAWAGVLNTHYWVDPSRDVTAVFMTQFLPFRDAAFIAAYESYEREVYAAAVARA